MTTRGLSLLPPLLLSAVASEAFHPTPTARPFPSRRSSAAVVAAASSSSPPDDGDAAASPSRPRPSVLCVGETLFDSLPSGIFLGGAPTNVAVHLSSLGTPTSVASCVGNDRLGDEAVRRLDGSGVDARFVQRHPIWGTGVVTATIDGKGDATYEFDTPAAWDGLALTRELKDLAEGVDVVVMGTIACRLGDKDGATSADTIRKIRNSAREDGAVLDVNLRPPWFDPDEVLDLARGVGGEGAEGKELGLVKLNDEELPIVEGWCDLPAKEDAMEGDALKRRMEALGTALRARRVCVTRGENGAALWCRSSRGEETRDEYAENEGYPASASATGDSDTVGAGDAFLASLVRSLLLEGESAAQALARSCALGGYVARCRGAVPDHDDAPAELKNVFSFS